MTKRQLMVSNSEKKTRHVEVCHLMDHLSEGLLLWLGSWLRQHQWQCLFWFLAPVVTVTVARIVAAAVVVIVAVTVTSAKIVAGSYRCDCGFGCSFGCAVTPSPYRWNQGVKSNDATQANESIFPRFAEVCVIHPHAGIVVPLLDVTPSALFHLDRACFPCSQMFPGILNFARQSIQRGHNARPLSGGFS